MDILATHNRKNDCRSYWKSTYKLNSRPAAPVSVEGVSNGKDRANIF